MPAGTIRVFPFRKVLPAAQLAICFVVLWLVRQEVLVGTSQLVLSHTAAARKGNQQIVIDLPTLTQEQERELAAKQRHHQYYMTVPVVLNFPTLILQLPYVIVAKREWTAPGIYVETWRVLSWPSIGLVFWWIAGRGLEALQAARREVICPRVHWIETAAALILTFFGGIGFMGLLTTTPNDRADFHFMALLAGALLWGILGVVVLAGRFRQWRIEKRMLPTAAS